jgi:hypothetical protein
MSLKLKAIARCRYLKLLANAMKSYPRAKDLNTKDRALEGFELFGSTKQKLNLPSSADYDSHRSNKVKYSIARLDSKVKRA